LFISTLCRSGKEDESDSWLPIQNWLLSLRSLGKSVLKIHHAGKSGQQRGTSRRVQAGVELLKVAAHLGHKNIQSTLRYAHLSPKVTEETGEAVAARIYGGMA
jgi:hypothetical protein